MAIADTQYDRDLRRNPRPATPGGTIGSGTLGFFTIADDIATVYGGILGRVTGVDRSAEYDSEL